MNSTATSTASLPSSRDYAAYIGLDWADRKHDICLYDPAIGTGASQSCKTGMHPLVWLIQTEEP